MIYLSLAPIPAAVFFPSSDGRTSLFATNIGAAIFGGTTPLLAAWLIHASGSLMAPSAYPSSELLLSILAARLPARQRQIARFSAVVGFVRYLGYRRHGCPCR